MKSNKQMVLFLVAALCASCIVILFTWDNYTTLDTTQVTTQNDRVSRNGAIQRRFPHTFIVGFGKTGTRALFDALLMHSRVVGPHKEVRFFDEHYNQGLTWYIRQMPRSKEGQQIVEKSPCYILHPEALVRLMKATKLYSIAVEELRFVVMFRHPIVRAISEYLEWQSLKAQHHGKLLPQFDVVALDKYGQVNEDFGPLNHSLYAYYVKQWLQIVNPNQFCFVNGDLFAEQPYDVMSKLEKCLGLPPEISKQNFVWEERRHLYCLSYHNKVTCPSLAKGRPHPFVQQNVVDILMNYYRPFNEELYAITGENYNWENDYKGLNVL